MIRVHNSKKPIVVLVVGVPGSGKSTIARALCRTVANSCYISKDMFQSPFLKGERIEAEKYEEVRIPTQKFLLSYAGEQIELGKTPIIDAPYSINRWRGDSYADFASHYRQVASDRGTELLIVLCKSPNSEALKRRLEERNYPWDRWKLENWQEFLQREAIEVDIDHHHVIHVVSDGDPKRHVEAIIKYIDGKINS